LEIATTHTTVSVGIPHMSTVTLIGTRLAESGQEFVYRGSSPSCDGCPYQNQCLNLDEDIKYRVVDTRDNAQKLECQVHDQGVRAVEVEPAPIRANIYAKNAYAGSRVQLPGSCPYTECPSHQYCEPEAGSFDRDYKISEIIGDPPHEDCRIDRDLTLALLPSDE